MIRFPLCCILYKGGCCNGQLNPSDNSEPTFPHPHPPQPRWYLRLSHCTTYTMAYCDRCDRSFPHDRAYEQHTENSHSHWICEDCEIDFASEEALEQHYANSPKHHYCRECDQHFSGVWARTQHMRAKHWYCETHDKVGNSFLAIKVRRGSFKI